MNLRTLITRLATLNSYGEDGTPLYADDFAALNAEVFALTEELYPAPTSTPEEEALFCITLLQGYNSTIYSNPATEKKKQTLLDRAGLVLDKLQPTALKCKLLLTCYGEIEVEELLEEAKEIIVNWGGRELTEEEKGVMEYYNIHIKEAHEK